MSWISAEHPGVVEAVPTAEPPDVDGVSASVLGTGRYESGRLAARELTAHVHPHGQWLWWHAT